MTVTLTTNESWAFGQTQSLIIRNEPVASKYVQNLIMEALGPNGKKLFDQALVSIRPGRGIEDAVTWLVTILNRLRAGMISPTDTTSQANIGFYISDTYTLIYPTDIDIEVLMHESRKMFMIFS